MPFPRRNLRPPVIAFVAILGGLVSSGAASACDMAKGAGCVSAKSCGCFKTPDPAPAQPLATLPTPSTVVRRPAPLRDAPACANSPAGGCVCETSPSDAPRPEPSPKPADGRSDPAGDVAFSRSGFLPSPAPLGRTISPSADPPQRTPLYLRTTRLLI